MPPVIVYVVLPFLAGLLVAMLLTLHHKRPRCTHGVLFAGIPLAQCTRRRHRRGFHFATLGEINGPLNEIEGAVMWRDKDIPQFAPDQPRAVPLPMAPPGRPYLN